MMKVLAYNCYWKPVLGDNAQYSVIALTSITAPIPLFAVKPAISAHYGNGQLEFNIKSRAKRLLPKPACEWLFNSAADESLLTSATQVAVR